MIYIFCTLLKYINKNKRNPSYNIINTIGDKYFKALKKPNKSKKYNSNTLKNRNNRTKRLAILSRCLNKQPKI